MPPEAITHLDAALNIAGNEKVLKTAGLRLITIRPGAWTELILA